MTTILFNPKGANGKGKAAADKLLAITEGDTRLADVTGIPDLAAYIQAADKKDCLVIVGGDGTLNYLANHVSDIPENLFYYPGGSGNDFWNDLGLGESGEPIALSRYLKNLPVVTVNGKESRFLNGVGYGIDGYCCEEGDRRRESSDKPVNYTAIAIRGLLFKFKPCGGTVTVDGQTHRYKKIWLAPTMKGRCYGGGMICAPDQDRLREDGTVSVVVMHDSGKLKTLTVFPSIFKGEHVKHTDMIDVFTGHTITVAFDRPCALQIDGETVLGVKEYSVRTC